ncbi:hypothetical protein K7432_008744 [Basidiobolus ranarum]
MSQTTLKGSIATYRLPNHPSISTDSECNRLNFNDENLQGPTLTYEEIQKKTFTKWINSQLTNEDHITSIEVDLRDGNCLLKLLETLTSQPLPKTQDLSTRIQRIANVKRALQFLKDNLGENISYFDSEDIVDGTTELTLELIWYIINKYRVQPVDKEKLVNSLVFGLHSYPENIKKKSEKDPSVILGKDPLSGDPVSRKDIGNTLLLWVQNQLSVFGNLAPLVTDFNKSWKNGIAFSALIHRHDPKLIAHPETLQARIERRAQEPREILNVAFLVAYEEMGVPFLLDVEDILNVNLPDEKSIITYVSEFYKVMSKTQKDEEYCRITEIAREELDSRRDPKKREEQLNEAIVVGDELVMRIQTSRNSLPIISDVETEVDRLKLGSYWALLTSFESVTTELANSVQAFISRAEDLTIDDRLLSDDRGRLLKHQISQVSTEYEHLCHEAADLTRSCKELQQIADKSEEISIFRKAVDELVSDVEKLITMRLSGVIRRERSPLLTNINHDIDELEQSVSIINNAMPISSPNYLIAAKDLLLKAISDTKTLIHEENLRFKHEKSAQDFQVRVEEITTKLTDGIAEIVGVESALLASVCDLGKYKTVLSEQKALLKSSLNSLKAVEFELSTLDATTPIMEEKIKSQSSNANTIVSQIGLARGLAQQWQEQLEKLTKETQTFDELFKYLQMEKLIRAKLTSIKSLVDSWDEDIAEHVMTQTGNGLRLLRKKFEDMTLLYSEAIDFQPAQEKHVKLVELLKESEKLYEEKWQELSQIGTPATRWQDTAKDIENVLENLRSTLSSRILIHGLSCTQEQHINLLKEIGQLDKEIIAFEEVTWDPFEKLTVERLGESTPGIRVIVDNIHQVLLGSWIEVQESLERRKREVKFISRGFGFRKLADQLEVKMSDINLLAKKIVGQEGVRTEAEAQLDIFKCEIENLSLEYEELFDSEDEAYSKRLTELEDTYESTRNHLIQSQKESNSKIWWHQAEAAKVYISRLERKCNRVPTTLSEFKTQADVDFHVRKIAECISNLENFKKNDLALLTHTKDCLDALPDEEKSEDLDVIDHEFNAIQFNILDIGKKLKSNDELMTILLEVLPLQTNLQSLREQLTVKHEEALRLKSDAKWSPTLCDISPLVKKYKTLNEELANIKEKHLLPHSQSISLALDVLENSPHPDLLEKKKEILKERNEALEQYESLSGIVEHIKLAIKQASSIVKVMSLATNLEGSVAEVRGLLEELLVDSESDDSIVAEIFKTLEVDLERLGDEVRNIPEIDILLDGGDVCESNLFPLQAATSRYQNLATSIQSVFEEFSEKKDNLRREGIHDEYMHTYIQVKTCIDEKEKELLSFCTETSSKDIATLEAQCDSSVSIINDISALESSYLSLNALRLKYEENATSIEASKELQSILHSNREIEKRWDGLKELASNTSDGMKSALILARFSKTAQNLFLTLDSIQKEIDSTDPGKVRNEIVLRWREQLEEVDQDTSSVFLAACECCTPEYKPFLRKEYESTVKALDRVKAQLAAFLASIKSSRLLAVYLDDAADFHSALIKRNQEVSDARSAQGNISGESLENDESQLDKYTDIYLQLKSDLRMYTARHDHLREYYSTILAQSADVADKISQKQGQIESEWAYLSEAFNGIKQEMALLRLHAQWYQHLRDAEQLMNSFASRIEQLDGIDSVDLQQELEYFELELEKCQNILNFTQHPDWSSLLKSQHPNSPALQERYTLNEARLNELNLTPINLKNTYINNSLQFLQQQLNTLQHKVDSIRNNNNISLNIGDEVAAAETMLRNSIMKKIKTLDALFTSSNLDQRHQNQRRDVEARAKALLVILDELKSWYERVQEFHELVDRIDNALGSSLDLIDQNPEERAAAYSILKQLEASFSTLSKRIPKSIDKARSLARGLDDWNVQERLRILPEQWEEMKSLVARRLQELRVLAKRRVSRPGLVSNLTERRFMSRSRSMSPHITWKPKLANSRSTWRPTSPITGSYMRPTLASLSRVSAVNPSVGSLQNILGNSPRSSPSPMLDQTKRKPQARAIARHMPGPIPKKLTPNSPNIYIPDPKDPLDIEVGRVVNSCPINIKITKANENGRYWIGEIDPKLCYCRVLISKMVMVRVGGGWAELSR